MTEKEFCDHFTSNIRRGNIELRKTEHFLKEDSSYMEIVCYYPNSHYGKENEYIWDDKKQMYKHPEWNYYLDTSCFKHKESCYTIATIEFDDEEDPNIRSCGRRPYKLEGEDLDNYINIVLDFYFAYDNYDE